MEKISGIIPATPRVVSVDLSEARPLRPGVPSFGRPVGITNQERVSNLASKAEADKIIEQDAMKLSLQNGLKEALDTFKSSDFMIEDKVNISTKAMEQNLKKTNNIDSEKENIMFKESTSDQIEVKERKIDIKA